MESRHDQTSDLQPLVVRSGAHDCAVADGRTGQNVTYSTLDTAMAAYGVFFLQSPSFLAHQEAMQGREQCNNVASLFGIKKIASDPQIRDLLDPVRPADLCAPFWEVFDLLE